MGNTALSSASPKAAPTGFRDYPSAGVQNASAGVPTFCPLSFLVAEWGSDKEAYFITDQLKQKYGALTFNPDGPYYNHSTDFMQNIYSQNGNAQFAIRLRPEDASEAMIRLWLEYVAMDAIPVYERNPDGSYVLDANGQPKPVAGQLVSGYKIRLHATLIPTEGNELFGQAQPKEGTLVGKTDAVSKMVPICDIPASYFGGRGNRIGFNLSAPNAKSGRPNDTGYMRAKGNYLFRLGFVEKDWLTGIANPWTTLGGQVDVDFTFNPNQKKPATKAAVSLMDVYKANYTFTAGAATTGDIVDGPVDGLHIYDAALKAALVELHTAEAQGAGAIDEENPYSVNFMSALDYDGNPYHHLVMCDVSELTDNAVSLNPYSNVYLLGGADGDISAENFDKMVANYLGNFGKLGIELRDRARYPFTVMADSGYSLETTKRFYGITSLNVCPDVFVITGTQDVLAPINRQDDDIASAAALIGEAALTPESTIWMTPFTRGMIVPYAGYPLKGEYTKLCSGTREIVNILSKWLGASEGGWIEGKDADVYPNNVVSTMTLENYSYPEDPIRDKMWENQLVAFETDRMKKMLVSGMQTINPNDNSILNGAINVIGCCCATRAAMRAYKELVGNSKYNNEQMRKRGIAIMTRELKGIGNNRLIFVPDVRFTKDDIGGGFSWTTVVDVYGPGMKTVNTIIIGSHNIAELEA